MNSTPPTKYDLRDFKKEIIGEISGVIADAVTIIGGNFQALERNFWVLEHNFQQLEQEVGKLKHDVNGLKDEVGHLSASLNRVQRKLGPTIARVDTLADLVDSRVNKVSTSIHEHIS